MTFAKPPGNGVTMVNFACSLPLFSRRRASRPLLASLYSVEAAPPIECRLTRRVERASRIPRRASFLPPLPSWRCGGPSIRDTSSTMTMSAFRHMSSSASRILVRGRSAAFRLWCDRRDRGAVFAARRHRRLRCRGCTDPVHEHLGEGTRGGVQADTPIQVRLAPGPSSRQVTWLARRSRPSPSGGAAVAVVSRRHASGRAARTVRNTRGELVTDLDRNAFTVYENGKRQPITIFRRDDIPVSVGLLIDNSGSMRSIRPPLRRRRSRLPKRRIRSTSCS